MKSSVDRQPGCQVSLHVEASAEEMAEAKESAFREAAPRVAVPGFRPGRAPRVMIEKQIGKERLLDQAVDDLTARLYALALRENDIHPYEQAQVKVTQRDPLVFEAAISIEPSVTLGDYRSIRVETETVTVDESEVDQMLLALQEERAEWAPPAQERPVHLGDQAVIDVRGVSEGEVFLERQGLPVLVSEERGVIVPGLASELIGFRAGVERRVSLQLPAEFSVEKLRGKQAEFTVTVRELKEKRLPAIDDEFAKSTGEFADLAALRERTRQAVLEDKERDARDRLEERVLGKLVEISTIEFPAVMLREEEELLLSRMSDRLKRQGLDLDTYLKVTQKSRTDLLQETEPQARKRIESGLALGKVAEAEAVAVDGAEVEAEIERMASGYGEKAAEARKRFSTASTRRSIQAMLLERKTLARLVELATSPQ